MIETPPSTFFSPCPRGLESVLQDELTQLGIQKSEILQGGVRFHGTFDLCYRVNLHSRIASRVLWTLSTDLYQTEDDIYQTAVRLPWPTWFSVRHSLKVHVSAHSCPLKSLEFVTLRIKDAICDHFRKATGSRPSVDTRTPDMGIYAFLDTHTVTFYLDTTGAPLFKRGLRHTQGLSPLRENLAAGILRLTGWTPGQTLLDPMCGSGTFLLEAAQMASHMAPGLNRHFAFENFIHFDQATWAQLQAKSRTDQRPIPLGTLFGCDHDRQAVQAARANLDTAGFTDSVSIEQGDVLTIQPPHPHGFLIANPPYGVRSGEKRKLAEWYPKLGDALKHRFDGWQIFLFTGDGQLPKLIRLAAARKTPLFNGPLECRLLHYPIVKGSHRSKSSGAVCCP